MDLGLAGKVAIVTGAGRGIGQQIALTLAEEGAKVTILDLFLERANRVVSEIQEAGGEALAIAADITHSEEVVEAVNKVVECFGKVDILVNNAGIPPVFGEGAGVMVPFEDTDRQQWDQWIAVNLYGALNCSRVAIKNMIAQRQGKIVSIVSDAGRVGEPRQAAYSACKGAIIAFTKAVAKEVGRYCINVNCVSAGTTHAGAGVAVIGEGPGTKVTEEQQKTLEAWIRAYPIGRGLGRLGLPSDVADAVAFLASERSPFVTGQVLSVSGGYSMVS